MGGGAIRISTVSWSPTGSIRWRRSSAPASCRAAGRTGWRLTRANFASTAARELARASTSLPQSVTTSPVGLGSGGLRRFRGAPRPIGSSFLALCAGTPRLVVTDFDKALPKALVGAFPRAADRAAELRLCELHLRRRLDNALAPLVDEPDHPVMRSFRHALFDHDNWSRFEAQARRSDQHGALPLPALMRWLDTTARPSPPSFRPARRWAPTRSARSRPSCTRSSAPSTAARRALATEPDSTCCST